MPFAAASRLAAGLAVVVAASTIATSPATATATATADDPPSLVERAGAFAAAHGATSAGRSDAKANDFTICRDSGGTDDDDAAELDIAVFRIQETCDRSVWGATFETFDDWQDDRLDLVGVTIDSDSDEMTGCDGIDFTVVHDGYDGSVVYHRTCDEATWELTGGAFITGQTLHDLTLLWQPGAIGAPRDQIWVAGELYGVGGSYDRAPGGRGLVVGPATELSNGRCYVPLDAGTTLNSVARLYRAAFGRDADQGGLDYWVPRYRSGELCIEEMADLFTRSAEFVATYGALGNPEFVRRVYLNVLGREPDPGGYEHWAQAITYGGVSRGWMLAQFSESDEFRERSGLP